LIRRDFSANRRLDQALRINALAGWLQTGLRNPRGQWSVFKETDGPLCSAMPASCSLDACAVRVPAPERGIVRMSDASFSPGDDFCSVWHFFDLIPEGAAGWQPKYNYA
jgi:hypothetical protein